jgi:hypothetical protein
VGVRIRATCRYKDAHAREQQLHLTLDGCSRILIGPAVRDEQVPTLAARELQARSLACGSELEGGLARSVQLGHEEYEGCECDEKCRGRQHDGHERHIDAQGGCDSVSL